jgi:uncharacterized protein YciU (UPF0263 family)
MLSERVRAAPSLQQTIHIDADPNFFAEVLNWYIKDIDIDFAHLFICSNSNPTFRFLQVSNWHHSSRLGDSFHCCV